MNADHSRRTFLLGGLATGAVLLAGKTFLHPSAAHAATEAVTLDACVNHDARGNGGQIPVRHGRVEIPSGRRRGNRQPRLARRRTGPS